MSTDCTRLQPPSVQPLDMKTMFKMLWRIRINLFELLPCGLKEVKCRAMKCLAREDGNYLRRPNYPNYLSVLQHQSLCYILRHSCQGFLFTPGCVNLSLSIDDKSFTADLTQLEKYCRLTFNQDLKALCVHSCVYIYFYFQELNSWGLIMGWSLHDNAENIRSQWRVDHHADIFTRNFK